MGKLFVGGQHRGTSGTAGDMHLPACMRSKRERSLLGCDKAEPPLSAADAARRRRRINFDEGRFARDMLVCDDDHDDKLRAVLSEMGILADDVEAVIARLKATREAKDDAPGNMGTGNSEEDVPSALGGGSSENAGGGSTRTYAPTDPGNFGMSGGAEDRARRSVRRYSAADEKRYHSTFPDADRLKNTSYAAARPSDRRLSPMTVAQAADYAAMFPHANRLKR